MYKFTFFANYINMKKLFLICSILFLNVISLVYLYDTVYFKKQLLFIVLGFSLMIILAKVNFKYIIKARHLIYLISIFLLALVLFIGKEVNGSKAWLRFSSFSIQPSEIAKLSLMLTLAYLINKRKPLIIILLVTAIPIVLTFLEPDTGAILIYLIILFSGLKYYKIKKKYLIILGSLLLVFVLGNVGLYFYNKELLVKIYGTNMFYRFDRLLSFSSLDNIQNKNSLISIGANMLLYIPENHNDFIFAAIVSKYNIYVSACVLLCLTVILIYFVSTYGKKNNIFNIFNFMILNTLLFQIGYNVLMNLSLVPIIGIPLPFVSYGGSYMLVLFMIIGLSLNFSSNKGKVDKV